MCIMKKNQSGSFFRDKSSSCVEITTTRDQDYNSFVHTAASCCKLPLKKGKKLVLFNLKGIRIAGSKVSKPWTIGGYFKAMKCSTTRDLKIGIGYIEDDTFDLSEDEVIASSFYVMLL